MSQASEPTPREKHIALWSGSKMIVWGGRNSAGVATNDGALYDPTANSWQSISTAGAPLPRQQASTIWTGSRMIIWGGSSDKLAGALNSGAIYDPTTDSWKTMSTVNAPSPRIYPLMGSTGKNLIVWGGSSFSPQTGLSDGAIYNLDTDTWTPMNGLYTPALPPFSDTTPVGVWTGEKIIVMDTGLKGGWWRTFDPILNQWTLSLNTAPILSDHVRAVWTGTQFILINHWGTYSQNPTLFPTVSYILTPFK